VLILFRAETFRKGFLNLEKNFKNLEAVAFVVNSNGGSAVASNCIANTLKTFCRVNKLKLFTFVDDAALSGGYWLHCIGDETFAYKSSKVGSVGAVLTTIDVGEILKSRGIERKYISSRNEEEK
jgi:ClpP class serine protease